MTRKELEELGLTAEQVEAVIKANGRDVEREKAKFADYDDLKAQFETANNTINGMSDYEEVKGKVAEYKQQAEKAQAEAAAKIATMELQGKIKDFTGTKKFVNDFTRDSINAALEKAVNDAANKGRSIEDLFKEMTDGKENIIVDDNKPTPPTVPPMGGAGDPADGVAAAFLRNNPNIKL